MVTPSGPLFGATIVFTEDVQVGALNPELFNLAETVDVEGLACHEFREEKDIVLHAASSRVWIIGTRNYLPSILQAAKQTPEGGVMPKLLSEIESKGLLQIVVALEPLKPMFVPMLQHEEQKFPPPFRRVSELANLFDAAWLNLDPATFSVLSMYDWRLRAASDADAEQAEQVLQEMMTAAQQMFLPEIMKGIEGDDKVSDAMRAYVNRMSAELSTLPMLEREGQVIRMSQIDAPQIASVGVLVGLLLPAVQAAREAARRMNASNNLKQIGLAMHNHHAAYRELPAPAITGDSGKPLLSWRVKILPFIEQQELYQQFRLDEPWDSPHNLRLVDEMPSTFEDPSAPAPPGHTVFKLPRAVGSPFEKVGEPRKFRDMLDGLSNTLMVVETDVKDAVPWTKPDDWNVDPSQPLLGTGRAHQGGFHVLMSDGAVKFVTLSIDPQLFRALMTHQGKERVDF
jgi:hypothetical protein